MFKGVYLIGYCNLYGLNLLVLMGNVVCFVLMYVKLWRIIEMLIFLYCFVMLLEYFDVSINWYVYLKIEGLRFFLKDILC